MQHILVPTDGSEGSLKAAKLAGDLARATDAKVTVLLVHDEKSIIADAWNAVPPAARNNVDLGPAGAARAALEDNALATQLHETRVAIGDVAKGIALEQLWGQAATETCSFAAANNVDLIVMGSHGRSALTRALLGSVSHAVVNSAGCAVTIAR
ncbi:MAG: universal stress protein [Pseudomonadota bacterium]